jgi:hypothetical protein
LGLRWGGCAAKSAPFLGLNPDVESGRLSHEVLPERVFAAAISLRGGAPLPEVRVTTDNTAISRSCPIVILAGIWIPDLNTKGVIHIAANDLTVELAPGSELRGLPDGLRPATVGKGAHRVPDAAAPREPSATKPGFPAEKRSLRRDLLGLMGPRSDDSET